MRSNSLKPIEPVGAAEETGSMNSAFRFFNRYLILFPLLLGMAVPVRAQIPLPMVAPVAALNAGLLQVMQQGKATPFQARMQTLTPIVQSSFDLDLILRNSIGPRFASFPAEQRAELLESFTQFTVASYVANFDALDGERFEILPALRQAGADTVVPTRIVSGGTEAAKLDYVVHPTATGYQIADVLLDGSISRVAVQRSDFRSVVANGDATPLISMLRRKVASFAAGARQ